MIILPFWYALGADWLRSFYYSWDTDSPVSFLIKVVRTKFGENWSKGLFRSLAKSRPLTLIVRTVGDYYFEQ